MKQPGLIFGVEANSAQESWKVPQPEDLPYLTGVTRLSMDCETSGKNPFRDSIAGISIAYRTDMLGIKKLYCPVGHASGNMDPEVVRDWLKYVLPDKEVVFANAKFDIAFLKGFGVDLEALNVEPHDVAFPDALLDDNRISGRSLEDLGLRYVGRGKAKFDGDKNNMADYPSNLVGPYACDDAALTLEVDEATAPFIKKEGLGRVLALENSIIYAVCEIERNGCRIDVEKLERWRKEVREEYERTIMLIHKQTGMMIQPGSGASIAKLFDLLGIKPPVRKSEARRKKGQTKKEFQEIVDIVGYTEADRLRAFEIEELQTLKHPVIDIVVKARQLDSLLSKFLDKYHNGLDGDILRAQFHQLKGDGGGTVRGRFSSSGGGDLSSGYSFNAQQVIKTSLQQETLGDKWIIRELFVPNERMRFCSIDASQIEYRLACHFANAESIVKAYRDDPKTDYHNMMIKAIQKFLPNFTNRTTAKSTNFAYVFNAREETLARTAGISVKEATEILAICRKVFPEAEILSKKLSAEAETRGFVTTLLGRRARFKKGDKFYAAINAVVQGSAADVFKLALKDVYDNRHTLGITKMRQIVHDEFDLDCLPDEQYGKVMQEFMDQQRIALRVPITWSISTGANWKECH